MADIKIVGGKSLSRTASQGCDCVADQKTIGGDGSEDHPFEVIALPGAQPFTGFSSVTIYARTDGNNARGNGSLDNPYQTLQRAVLDVSLILQPGVSVVLDITGIDETLPPNYILPAWKCPVDLGSSFGGHEFFFITGTGVAIQATPQLVAALSPADAVVNLSDVATFGGVITNVTNTAPIQISTSLPHGLSTGDSITIINVAGLIDPMSGQSTANGTWTVTATGLNTFTLDGSDGTTSSPYAGGGTVIDVAADPITTLLTITLSGSGRAAWGTSSQGVVGSGLKGKFIVGAAGSNETTMIYQNTPSTLSICVSASNPGLPTFPLRIMEPSAHLHASGSDVTFTSIQAQNCDSIAFNGLKITSDDGNLGLGIAGMGQAVVQMCELESAIVQSVNDFQAKLLTNWWYGFPTLQSQAFSAFGSVFDNIDSFGDFMGGPPSAQQPTFRNNVFDNCETIRLVIFAPFVGLVPCVTPLLTITNCLIRGSTGDALQFHGGSGLLRNVDISGALGNGITADSGTGLLRLENVQTSGPANGGIGLLVNDGMQVKADAATSGAVTPLTGSTAELQIGNLVVPATWAAFTGNAPDFTGPTATGSRLFQ